MNDLVQVDQTSVMATRLNIDASELTSILVQTIMPPRVNVTQEQFVSFLAIANEYKLNPLTKEIYAFPAKGGGIQAIVSIDGWLNIINSHPAFDGMEIEFSPTTIDYGGVKGVPEWCKCRIYRKDRRQPVEVVEYLTECFQGTDPWKKKPRRMLQHKAAIQCARYAFGISGIIDEDEKDVYKSLNVIGEDEKPNNDRIEKVINDAPIEGELVNEANECLAEMESAESLDLLQEILAQAWAKYPAGNPCRTLIKQKYDECKAKF